MSADRSPRRSVQLLATAVAVGEGDERGERACAQIHELGEKELVLEAARELERGERLEVSFFVPIGRRFQRVSVLCRVGRVVDEEEMLFAAGIDETDDASRQALADYVAGANGEGR